MPAIELKRLVNCLGETPRRCLESAAGYTLSRTHFNVELEHWLLQMLDRPRADLSCALQAVEISAGTVRAELLHALDRMKTGNGRAPSLSPEVVAVIREAWLFASVERGEPVLRGGHILWAALADDLTGQRLASVSPALFRLGAERLRRDFANLLAGSEETPTQLSEGMPRAAVRGTLGSGGDALAAYTIDLTEQARGGSIDPILGRDAEIRQVIDILTRRRQNNPVLAGEAGVGKTAIVEGLAQRIALQDVPPALRDTSIRTLDLGLLQAGAGMKGEFENRLRGVIEDVRASPTPIILFVDEAHMLIGAGGAEGQGDAANLLKPALARGALRMIAATTWAEYKKYFEKDAALTRRFQTVKVEEPSEAIAIAMIRGLLPSLESHHKVRILDEALTASVRLSSRFIPDRQLPDKAVSLIDTACARVGMSQSATPAAMEAEQRRAETAEAELRVLRREELAQPTHGERIALLQAEIESSNATSASLRARWEQEGALVSRLQLLQRNLEEAPGEHDRTEYQTARTALSTLQGDRPMIFPAVDGQAVAEIVEHWTGIPAGRMREDDVAAVLDLRETLKARVVGQDHALEAVSRAIRTSRAGLTDPRKPVGVFLMVGTSGVGKTETALALADLLYGGEQNLTVINMSEFKEEHKVSLLMGAPPGYVGYGEGGVLTEAVRRKPHSVILLDEMEKAHPGVQDVFFQVFDKGTMKDGQGRDIDFRHAVIIMTSNAASDTIASLFADPDTAPDAAGLAETLRGKLAAYFKPAFLGRVTLVPYLPLSSDVLGSIVNLQLDRVRARVRTRYGVTVSFSAEVTAMLLSRCVDGSAGARALEAIIGQDLLPALSAHFLSCMAARETIGPVHVAIGADGGLTLDSAAMLSQAA